MFGLDAWIALSVTAIVFIILQVRRGAPVDLLFLGAAVAVTLTGVITPEEALQGFSSTAVITIGSLLAVAAGLQATGVLDYIGVKLLGSAQTDKQAVRRLAVVLVSTSVFLLNTVLVAMVVPVVLDWCRRRNVSPSRLMIPVSYLVILGGVCSLIGTSTTLIVNDLLKSQYQSRSAMLQEAPTGPTTSNPRFVAQLQPLALFEIGRVGLPCALVGTTVLILLGRRLLPDRTEIIEQLDEQRREYLVELLVQSDCRLIGQTVESAGLRQLPGLFLIEIDRDGEIITPVRPDDVIRAGDRLVFTGLVNTIVDLEKIPGLVPATDLTYGFQSGHRRHMTEAVLSRTSPLIGRTVRTANFRRRYNAAVVAVHRNGERLSTKIGDIRLRPGDTLLLQTRDDFVQLNRHNPDFYLVSSVEGYAPRRHEKALVAAGLGCLMILALILGNLEPVRQMLPLFAASAFPAIVALTFAVLMVLTRCIAVSDARSSINLQVLLTIVGALALGRALEKSGAAEGIAHLLVEISGGQPYLLLIVIYLMAMVFTEMITNNAVATILLPLAISVAEQGQFNPRPFVMAIALAASLAFMTPIGYQTNLMVMGPGGYRPLDYLRAGLPVAFLVTVTALVLIPWFWGLQL